MRRTGKTTKKIKPGMIESLIGEKTKVEGTIQVSGTTRIDGCVKGSVISDGTLIIGESGRLEGDGRAQNVLVAGMVCGNLTVDEKTEITSKGSVLGDVKTRTLIIEEGAVFTGRCEMEPKAEQEQAEAREEPLSALREAAAAGTPAAAWTQDS